MKSEIKTSILLGILVFGGIIVFTTIKDRNAKLELTHFAYNFAVITYKSKSSRNWARVGVEHSVNGETYQAKGIRVQLNCFRKLEVGDTIFIKYAQSNKSNVKMESCYWNRETQLEKIR